jgi:hypothetical protein
VPAVRIGNVSAFAGDICRDCDPGFQTGWNSADWFFQLLGAMVCLRLRTYQRGDGFPLHLAMPHLDTMAGKSGSALTHTLADDQHGSPQYQAKPLRSGGVGWPLLLASRCGPHAAIKDRVDLDRLRAEIGERVFSSKYLGELLPAD